MCLDTCIDCPTTVCVWHVATSFHKQVIPFNDTQIDII